MSKRRVLIVTDFAATTGFASVGHNLLTRIPQDRWDIRVLGINCTGDPHPIKEIIPFVYPAATTREHDAYGAHRFPDLVESLKPDLIVIQSDAWLIKYYMQTASNRGLKIQPVIAYCPPDAPNQHAGAELTAHGVTHLICPTQFGIDALMEGGWDGPSSFLPYGVDRDIFKPMDRRQARQALLFPDDMMDAFLIVRADRNAQRKRYDLTLEGFAEWWHGSDRPADAFLFFHCMAQSTGGFNLPQLAHYYGISSQLKFTTELVEGRGIEVGRMPLIYNSGNLHLSTAMGEGFGLTALESAACGIPQAVVNTSAYGEWLKDVAHMLPVVHHVTTVGGVNTIGGATSPTAVAEAIDQVYRNDRYRTELGAKALACASNPQYSWDALAAQFAAIWEEVLGG